MNHPSLRLRSLPAALLIVLLVGLSTAVPSPAARKRNNNNNRQKIEQMRRQMAQQAAAQARLLSQQIKVMDGRITTARANMNQAREYMDRALSPMQQSRTESEFAKRELTAAKQELNEIEAALFANTPANSAFRTLSAQVDLARTEYQRQRERAERNIQPSIKGVEREKQITAIAAVLASQQKLGRTVDLLEKEKRSIGSESANWTAARTRLNQRIDEEQAAQKTLDQRVSVYNKYRIAANRAEREMNNCLQMKQTLVAQRRAAEQVARRYSNSTGSGRNGSQSGRSPGGKGR